MPSTPMRCIAEAILGFAQRRSCLERDLAPAAIDLELQRLARAGAHDLLHVGEALDRPAIDGDDQIAGLESGGGGGAVGLDRVDPRRRARLAKDHEEGGENHDGKYEIRHRAGHHDRRPTRDRLMHEAVPALFLAHGGKRRRIGNARGILVTEEFYIAAERNGGDLPSGVVAIIEAEQLRAEADRKDQDLDAAPAGDQEMAELVEKHDDGQTNRNGMR